MPGKPYKRIVANGFLLLEYNEDDGIYNLVGIVNRSFAETDMETGVSTDDEEAEDFFQNGTVLHPAKMV